MAGFRTSFILGSGSGPEAFDLFNSAWNLLNLRSAIIKPLVAQGYKLVLAALADESLPALEALGSRFTDLPMWGTQHKSLLRPSLVLAFSEANS